MARTLASQRLLELTLPAGARVATKGDAVELSLHRSSLHVAVTVPVAAHEWFVEASDRTSGAKVEDWRDYDGHDSSTAEQLDRDMADEVGAFISRLLSSELRLGARDSTRIALEWKIGERWEQAVPLAADAV